MGRDLCPFRNGKKTLKTVVKLKLLMNDNWIVLTTKDGSRGTDFKGPSPAHVLMTFQPSSYAECVQALGRGSRNLDHTCSGTIICTNPVSIEPNLFIKSTVNK